MKRLTEGSRIWDHVFLRPALYSPATISASQRPIRRREGSDRAELDRYLTTRVAASSVVRCRLYGVRCRIEAVIRLVI